MGKVKRTLHKSNNFYISMKRRNSYLQYGSFIINESLDEHHSHKQVTNITQRFHNMGNIVTKYRPQIK
jgi:hypothetical protein